MQDINHRAITTDRILLPQFTAAGIEMDMLRLDKIHPLISGNKWFKLRYYLEEAKALKKKRVITFGGAWSNHLLATAAACKLFQLSCTGIVRGEKPPLPPDTLQRAAAIGMQLVFLDRTDYATMNIPVELCKDDHYFIQQGGYGEPGVRGAAEIMQYTDQGKAYTHIFCAVGTGTMLAGLLRTAIYPQQVTGISVLKNNFQLEEEVKRLTAKSTGHFRIIHDYHFGGYARQDASLLQFMNEWYTETGIPTDIVYTGKLCFAVNNLVKENYFLPGSRVLLIHSGGLAGNASLKKGKLIF